MILIAATGIIGGACSFAALLPFGWLAAVLGMPFGGSLAATAVACVIAHRRARVSGPTVTGTLDPARPLGGEARPA